MRSRAVGWAVLLAGSLVLLRLAGGGDLSAPPLTSLDALADWGDARDPATTGIALVRFVAEITAWYLVGLTLLYGVAGALRSGGVGALADALAVPGARRLVRSGLGLGLLASTAAGAATADPGHGDPQITSTATMQPDPPPAGSHTGTAWMVPDQHATARPETPTMVAPRPTTWTVAEGESFWSIAADALSDRLGYQPSDTEIDPYWRALIDANRDRLVDRDDPDLIHPGQVFELPAPPPPH